MKKIFTRKGLITTVIIMLVIPAILVSISTLGALYANNKLEMDGYYVQENRTIEPEWLVLNRKHKGCIYPQQEYFYYH